MIDEKKLIEDIEFSIKASNLKYDNYMTGLRNGMIYCLSLITGKEPKFEKCNQWVPCSERLPEIRQACLVTVKYTGFMGMYGTWVKTGHMEYENDWMGDCVGGEVIAWMPLPEPYIYTESEDNKHD